jgi:hypothetical protein
MAYEHISVDRDGRILVVTINRPERMNALHPPANAELDAVFNDFAADPDLWVAIITGASRGIGRGIATELAKSHSLVATYRGRLDAAESLRAETGAERPSSTSRETKLGSRMKKRHGSVWDLLAILAKGPYRIAGALCVGGKFTAARHRAHNTDRY